MVKHLSFFFIFLILNSYQISFIKASGAFLSAMLIRLFGIVSLIVIFFIIYNFYSKNVISVIVALVSSYLIMFGISFIVEKKILRELKHSHKIEN
jgi:FtsH-binding integral membrane protein